ncbi:MAG: hypothetical protein DI635_14275 [Pseudoxanthomonas suwonensis]|nr:MAG: hypothetical protein DI635_14275 [Pseudoxanthomonas suwonensis]
MDQHREFNRETWAALKEFGVVPGSPLTIDAFFYCPDESAAQALASELGSNGWRTDVGSQRTGLLRRRVLWVVEAQYELPAAGLEQFDAMTDELGRLAAAHGAEFDGWGAHAPG